MMKKTAAEWFHLGIEAESPEKKLECYSKCLELDPDDDDAWYNKGIALRKLGRYEDAIACFDKALAIKPDKDDAWYNKGNALHKLGRYEDAIACYDKAIAIKPDKDAAWHNKGYTLRKLGRYEDAIACYDKALAIKPDKDEAWNNKGYALRKLGRYEDAIACYDKALAIKPDYDVAKRNKEIAEEKLERERKEHISHIESEIAELKSSGVEMQRAESLLKQTKAELNKNNFGRAKELAEKARKVANERKTEYDLAVKSISEAERVVSKVRTEGVVISDELLTKSKQAFDDGDYEGAYGSAEKLKSLVKSQETKYRGASGCIKSAKSVVEKAEELGCDISSAFSLLKEANSAFSTGNYEEAIKYSKQSEDATKKIQEESRPEVTLNLPEETFPPNHWKKIDVTIRNTGSMHAKDIKIKPSDDIKFKRISGIKHLNTNEAEVMTISMMSTVTGEVPIDIAITYKDALDRDYTSSEEVWVIVADSTPERPPSAKQAAAIEIKRGYEVLSNNDLRFGIRVTNNTDYAIMDVKTIIDYPRILFSLKGSEIQTLSNIDPRGKRTATYQLTPKDCIHNEKIDATAFYKDHTGSSQNVPMRPKEVHCVCPYLKEKPMREGEFAQLADASEHIQEGLLFMGVGVGEIAGFIKESCVHRLCVIGEHEADATKVVYLAGESLGETAYYMLTAVIQPYEGITQVALRAYSDKPYGLHGFLKEMTGSLRQLVGSVQSAREIGVIEKKQVINIIDSSLSRVTFADGIGEGTGTTNVNIEDSVLTRSQLGSTRRCPNCEAEVSADEKFCTGCGARLG